MNRRRTGWRMLGWFWVVVLIVLAGGAVALQAMGTAPPRLFNAGQAGARRVAAAASAPVAPPAPPRPPLAQKAMAVAPPIRANTPANTPWANTPGHEPQASPKSVAPIAQPYQAMLEPAPDFPGRMLPRKAPDGSGPMQAYAAPFDASDSRPRVAVLLDGIGLSESESRAAIAHLPAAISLAFSAYTVDPKPLLDAARGAGHEFLISIPMEPAGYPLNAAGPHALLVGATPQANRRNLEWVLSRFEGYVGATGAADGLKGERYAAVRSLFGPLLQTLAQRGLLYVDPRPGAERRSIVASRHTDPIVGADLTIDAKPDAADIDHALARLETLARDHGSALGIAGPPRPVTLARIAAWATSLPRHGIALVPVSAIVR